jgi:gentisate 1,2-dioxygenase
MDGHGSSGERFSFIFARVICLLYRLDPKAIPYLWSYGKVRPKLLQAAELILSEQAERRVLMLTNPSLGNYWNLESTKYF